MKLNVIAFALAFGIWWGAGLFLATWWLIATGNAEVGITMIERLYPGYSVSVGGSVIGLIWGLFCGTVCGGILAWLYNMLAERVGKTDASAKQAS